MWKGVVNSGQLKCKQSFLTTLYHTQANIDFARVLYFYNVCDNLSKIIIEAK